MPTPAERKTLLFFSMILLLGASTRAYRTLHGQLAGRRAHAAPWRAETDKVGFDHLTPLSEEAVSILGRPRRNSPKIGDCWIFPSPANAPDRPLPCEIAIEWWREAEKLEIVSQSRAN